MIRRKSYGVFNVVAQPHPIGVYREIFLKAGLDTQGVNFYGDSFSRVSPPTVSHEGIFRGRLAIWTEIDPQEPVIYKASLEQALIENTEVSFPEGVGYNSKIFYFSFRESDHTLFVELENDSGNSLSVGQALKAFSKILETINLSDTSSIEIYQKTKSNAVGAVLEIPRLRKIEIVINIPNPDDLHEDVQSMFDEINSMNAKKLVTEITKSSGNDTLQLTHRYRVMAEVAKDNGYVRRLYT